ncbi:hypothetical protein ABH926_002740 [Catenulispora sp. GP43]|uniref:SHOCT domain-containing protein n=1 Tax=Catenulispora sp. GP43 TaxID=3156263 RepID=UPI0035182506
MGKKDPLPAGTTRIHGSDGSMTFDGQYVTVMHKWLSDEGRGEAQFPLGVISGVNVRNGLILASVTLVIQGGIPPRKRKGDPLTVHGFGKEEAALFRDMVVRARAAVDAVPMPEVPEHPATPGLVGELRQLADLHAQGMLTAEEFGIAKAKLLGTSAPEDSY